MTMTLWRRDDASNHRAAGLARVGSTLLLQLLPNLVDCQNLDASQFWSGADLSFVDGLDGLALQGDDDPAGARARTAAGLLLREYHGISPAEPTDPPAENSATTVLRFFGRLQGE